MSQPLAPTTRTRVVREADRGVYDRETIDRILDEGFICHVGFVVDGQPSSSRPPTAGPATTSTFTALPPVACCANLDKGIRFCITITLLDGLVLARSIFNHSMNYRSVVVLGIATMSRIPPRKSKHSICSPSTSCPAAGPSRVPRMKGS